MPRTVETILYQFDELNEKAKERARAWYREASAGDNYFAEAVIEDANNMAAAMGLELKQRPFQTVGGGIRTEPAVSWSGFWSQGDGASFEGSYYYKPNAAAAVAAEAPQDAKLQSIAADLDAAQARYDGKIQGTIARGNDRYCHEHTMRFDFELEGEGDEEAPREIDEATETELKEAFRAFARWIYDNLEKEYEYQNSDEQVDETIRANEYEFEASGERA